MGLLVEGSVTIGEGETPPEPSGVCGTLFSNPGLVRLFDFSGNPLTACGLVVKGCSWLILPEESGGGQCTGLVPVLLFDVWGHISAGCGAMEPSLPPKLAGWVPGGTAAVEFPFWTVSVVVPGLIKVARCGRLRGPINGPAGSGFKPPPPPPQQLASKLALDPETI